MDFLPGSDLATAMVRAGGGFGVAGGFASACFAGTIFVDTTFAKAAFAGGVTAATGTVTLREAEEKALLAGGLHVRLYTLDQPLGAARARLRPAK